MELDGVAVDPCRIPLADDGSTHRVTVVLGAKATPDREGRPASLAQAR